jgi:hypothetical protein
MSTAGSLGTAATTRTKARSRSPDIASEEFVSLLCDGFGVPSVCREHAAEKSSAVKVAVSQSFCAERFIPSPAYLARASTVATRYKFLNTKTSPEGLFALCTADGWQLDLRDVIANRVSD